MKDGTIISWVIYDPRTLELVVQCATRKRARELAGKGGKIAAVVGAH